LQERVLLARVLSAMVVMAYVLIGVLGHDPWKQDETYTFGIIEHMFKTGDWVVPTNAGQPFMEKPPLYAWTACAFIWLLGHWLPVFDAARLASAFFTAITLLFLARSVREVYELPDLTDARVAGTLAVFASTLMVVKHSHDLMTDAALLAGASIALYGMLSLALSLERAGRWRRRMIPYPVGRDESVPIVEAGRLSSSSRAGLWLGLGVGLAMMAKGVFMPLVFGVTAVAIAVLIPACRERRYGYALLLATLVFVPFATIWPMALAHRSPALFKVWFWDNNIGRFFGFSVSRLGAENDKHLFILRALLTSAFPIGPLALLGMMRGSLHRLRNAAMAVPFVLCAVGSAVLSLSATARQLYLLPFAPALALLACDALPRLPARLHRGWDYLSRVMVAIGMVAIWGAWAIMGRPLEEHAVLERLSRWLPLDYVLVTPRPAVALAVLLTLGWAVAIRLAPRTGAWRGAVSWAASIGVLWGLTFTLLLPWIDYSKNYRTVYRDLAKTIAPLWQVGDCMASSNLGESEAPMLELYTGIEHRPLEVQPTTSCRWLIVQYEGQAATRPPGNWVPVWGGSRPDDDEQILRVYWRKDLP
jgi:4-amino-4-deoxy-L-arabinose transferase-like glycosyltransferase